MQPSLKIAEIRLSKVSANIVGTALATALCSVGVVFAHALPWYQPTSSGQWLGFCLAILLFVPVHEGLRALALRLLVGIPTRHLRFEVDWRGPMCSCCCLVPVRVRAYRRVAITPLLITGTALWGALVVFPSDWLGLLAGMTLSASFADVWMFEALRKMNGNLLVHEVPPEIGCDVLPAVDPQLDQVAQPVSLRAGSALVCPGETSEPV